MVLADQAFAAGFSAALSSGMIGWAITLACYAGIIVGAVPYDWKKLAPVRRPTTTVNPPGPVDPTVIAYREARAKKCEARDSHLEAAATIDLEIKNDDAAIDEVTP